MTDRYLTVMNLIEDLRQCDPLAEVACMMKGCEISIPIGQLSSITAAGKKYALLLIAPESIEYAMSTMQKIVNATTNMPMDSTTEN